MVAKRRSTVFLTLSTAAMATLPQMALALGLGGITLQSALNEPLRARIELVNIGDADASDFHVHLAANEAFVQAGVDRTQFLYDLVFTPRLRTPAGSYIEVTSRSSLVEPCLGFIVQLEQPGGKQLREFTLLVDPPRSDGPLTSVAATAPTSMAAAAARPAAPVGKSVERQTSVTPRLPEVAPSPGLTAGNGIYQTRPRDTLWRVAKRLGPLASRSADQLMADLFALNPIAFTNNDPDRLKAGQRLRLPASVNEPSSTQPVVDGPAPAPAPTAAAPASAALPTATPAPTAASESASSAVAASQSAESTSEDTKPLLVTQDLVRQVGDLEGQLTQLQDHYDTVLAQKEALIVQLQQDRDGLQQKLKQARSVALSKPVQAAAPSANTSAPQAVPAASDVSSGEADAGGFSPRSLLLAGAAAVLALLGVLWWRRQRGDEADATIKDEEGMKPAEPLPEPVLAATQSLPAQLKPASPTSSAPVDDHVGRAEIYIAYGRYGQAREVLESGLADDESRQDLRLLLLRVLASLGEAQAFSQHEQRFLALGHGEGRRDN